MNELQIMSFKLAKFFNISPFSFNNVDFFEFLEQFDLMEDYYRQKENSTGTNLQSLFGG
jgi:hypothetical protein